MSVPNAIPKTHPATREATPDDPLSLHAFEVPGDSELMVRLLAEEYARVGFDAESILQMARDPNYVAFHGLLRRYGENELRRRLETILARCGVMRVRATEAEPPKQDVEHLIQIQVV